MQQTSETKMITQIADLMARMRREEVPECWLLTPQDIVGHAIDELMDEEIDEEEMT